MVDQDLRDLHLSGGRPVPEDLNSTMRRRSSTISTRMATTTVTTAMEMDTIRDMVNHTKT